MAFKINETEKVKLGEIEAVPQVNAELLMRLGSLSFKDSAEISNAEEVIASAFPTDESAVLAYLRSGKVPIFELMRLHAYLQGGEKAVEAYDGSFVRGVNKAIDGALKNA